MTTINEILARAGASDANRDEWLAERRLGLTATEAKHLYMGGSIDGLALLKVLPASDNFKPNKYLSWGKEREPMIARDVAMEYPFLAHESRVFKSAMNDRYLASPDMIGPDGDRIALAEIKTSKHDLTPGSLHFDSTGYYYQMQWQMFVLDADYCVFAWERHHDDWLACPDGVQRPQTIDPVQCVVIDRDEECINGMIAVADKFFKVMDEIQKDLLS